MRHSALVRLCLLGVACLALSACGNKDQAKIVTALQTTPGQLFCALDKSGGQVVVGLIDGVATAKAGTLAPVAILATNQLASTVQADCALAAQNAGATSGVPVSPPPSAAVVATVAIDPSKAAGS